MTRTTQFEKHVDVLLSGEGFENKGLSPEDGKLLHAALLVADEAGELISPIKKYFAYGKPLDTENILEEAGDLLFSVTAVLLQLGFTLEQAMTHNREKLAVRYPDGFTLQAGLDRADKQGNEQ